MDRQEKFGLVLRIKVLNQGKTEKSVWRVMRENGLVVLVGNQGFLRI